jgi:hypothetical protein
MPRAADMLGYRTGSQFGAGQTVDRSIPMATPTGEFIPTPPTASQEAWQGALSNPSVANILYGAGEATASLLSSPLPYVAGMVGYGYGALTGKDPKETGAQFQQATTLQPKTALGQYYTEQVGDKLSALPPVISGIPAPRIGAGATRYAGQQYGMPMLEKSLTMYEQGKLTPGFKPVSEMFVGPTSKTWDANASTMIGPEGLKRQEISDKNTFLRGTGNYQSSVMDFLRNNEDLVNKQGGEVLLKNVFEAPDLYAAYPELQNYNMRFLPPEGALKGKKGNDNTMWVRENLTPEEARSTILHEIQHHIQENEGFAKGGSQRVFQKKLVQEAKHLDDAITRLNAEMKKASGTPKYEELMDEKLQLIKEGNERGILYPDQITAKSNDMYARLGGEAEARLTQARANMTKEELATTNPYDPKYFKEATKVDIDNLIMQGNKKPTDIFSILYK